MEYIKSHISIHGNSSVPSSDVVSRLWLFDHTSLHPLVLLNPQQTSRVLPAPPILPPSPPPLLPSPTVKLLLPQLDIDRIVRLTHPLSKLVSTRHPRRIPPFVHPAPEIVRAHPARIKLPKQRYELLCFGLSCRCRRRGVVGRHCVEEGPGAAAQGFDIGRTVRG